MRMSDCIEWHGARKPDGYGVTSVNGRTHRAHRVAYENAHGPIPEGMFVCHTCDNRGCVNPGHLWLGTPSDNMRDMAEKGRARGARGEEHHSARLTADDVRAIRARLGSASQKELAVEYGVSKSAISKVATGRLWSHV